MKFPEKVQSISSIKKKTTHTEHTVTDLQVKETHTQLHISLCPSCLLEWKKENVNTADARNYKGLIACSHKSYNLTKAIIMIHCDSYVYACFILSGLDDISRLSIVH